jgi:TRAP-type C4-dicarboxylate transport system permease small subunit
MLAIIETIERWLMQLGIASGLATLAITLVVVVDVTARFVFNAPIHGANEASELLLVVMVFMGLAAAQQGRQNYAIDMATRHLPQAAQALLELFAYVFCLVVVAALAWFSTRQAIDSFGRGEAGFGVIPFPIWPARFVLAGGLWLLAVQFACDVLRHLMGRPRAVTTAGSHE